MNTRNQVTLIGRLGKDPELTSTPNGGQVTRFTIATDDSYTDRDGNRVERTDWHNVECWGGLAEVIARYCRKGKEIALSGKLKTDSWEKDGEKKYKTYVLMEDFAFIGKKED